MRRLVPLLVPAALAALCVASVRAEEAPEAPPPKLEKHPYSDAKPGEWRRVKRVFGGETKFLRERVLAVKAEESKVFHDVVETSEDGKEMRGVVVRGQWTSIPKFEPTEGQEFKKDEMVWLEVGDKRVAARHFKIVEPVKPPFPQPTRTREVWYSNDCLGSGKVQELIDTPATVLTAVDWGTMSDEELAKARAEYKLDESAPADKPADAPAPGEKPAGGGGSSCGGGGSACGGK
jgi:hypothetical protein